jgi:glycosyltransferase involved in cell wall biosynthesis
LIFLVPGETGGMEVAARELIGALLAEAPAGMRFTAFVNREAAAVGFSAAAEVAAAEVAAAEVAAAEMAAAEVAAAAGARLTTVAVPVKARNRVQWVLGEQAVLPRLAARAGVDLMHSLASTAPLWGRFRRVVTVHDLIYARFPEAHAGVRDLGMKALVPAAARRSDRVIVDSLSTRKDVVELIGVAPERIDVVPLGLGAARHDRPLPKGEVRARHRLLDRRVVLALSAKRPHKNLAALIDALARLPAEERPVLVLPGYPTAHEQDLRARAHMRGVDGDVRFLAWVADAELETLWGLADAFVFPSLYEGFGLPVLEAMARGVPVACADASSLPEVAGDAALLFDPHDAAAIATALRRLLDDPALAADLVARGHERVREFTWQRTARLTLDSYARALGRPVDASAREVAG